MAGLFFLIIIGSLLQSQPLYIKGPVDPAAAAQGCYQGGKYHGYTNSNRFLILIRASVVMNNW